MYFHTFVARNFNKKGCGQHKQAGKEKNKFIGNQEISRPRASFHR
jgi:hypothetical protein